MDVASVPISDELRILCGTTGADPVQMALAGGEDYRLLVTVDPVRFHELGRAIAGATGRELYDVGTIVSEPGIRLRATDGSLTPMSISGWDHFTSMPGVRAPWS